MYQTLVKEQNLQTTGEVDLIGHFRVAVDLIMKARLSAKFLLGKLVFIHIQTKLIFI